MKGYNTIKGFTIVETTVDKHARTQISSVVGYSPEVEEEISPTSSLQIRREKEHPPHLPRYSSLDDDIAEAMKKLRQRKAEKEKKQ